VAVPAISAIHDENGRISSVLISVEMKRREFFTAASSLMLPVMVDGFGFKSFNRNSGLVQSLMNSASANTDRILVMVYLSGGNDGLNTVIPIEHYSKYDQLRHNIAIPENRILPLYNGSEVGFHPAMTGMRNMYAEGKLAIVHDVSYPNPNQSHTRSTDIWMTGVDSDKFSLSGWAGRYLNDRFPGYPQNFPNSDIEDPLAIQIGYMGTPTLLHNQLSMQVTIKNPLNFYQLLQSQNILAGNDLPCCDAGDLVAYIRQQQALGVGYGTEIKAAAEAGKNLAAYPAAGENNELAEQLKIVARLIHGGLKSKIYYVDLGGFDTHAAQVGSNTTEGSHAILLKKLSDAIAAFQNDLHLQGTEGKVIGMTFSDFGRRATANASFGTDHGVAAPMFIFGTGVKRQVIGTHSGIVNGLVPAEPPVWDSNQDIKMQIDFRRVYADILNDWFGTPSQKTDALLFKNFKTTSLFSDTVQTLASGPWSAPEIWSNGRVPATNEQIRVNAGHVISVGQDITAKDIQVDGGGELKFLGNQNVTITG
jgi:uncharacterized protein (DUF1501 family)